MSVLPASTVRIAGEFRTFGWEPPSRRTSLVCGGPLAQVPKEAWTEFEYTKPTRVKDQGNRGACNGHAAASTLELCRWIGLGTFEAEALSPWYIYAILCNGFDRGSSISDALELLQREGTCLESLVPYSLINPRLISKAAHEDAANHKISLGGLLDSWDDICNAVQLRRPVNLSVRAGNSWGNVAGDGTAPVCVGQGNHAVGVGWGMRRGKDGDWQVKMQNSWGTKWGVDGYCWLTRKHWESQGSREAYYVEAASIAPGTEPPTVIV